MDQWQAFARFLDDILPPKITRHCADCIYWIGGPLDQCGCQCHLFDPGDYADHQVKQRKEDRMTEVE